MGGRGFWLELKRRHVYRVAAAYAVIGWLLIQVATQVFPVFHLPDWIEQAVVLVILVGFPIALVLAWAFDATPHGIVATDAAADGGVASVPSRRRSRRTGMAVGLMGVLIAAIAGGAWWQLRAPRGHPSGTSSASVTGARSLDEAQRNPGNATPDSAAKAASSGLRDDVAALPIPAKSIAVLPFENLSTDKGNAYFADGMQDLILTKLADIGDLKVISRTSTEKYKSHPDDLKTIGQQLGVATILEGSVQKAGNQVLINVQLIDARSDSHIWAESYTRTLDNIFGVEGEVAQKVADALKAKLTSAESARVANVPTTNAAALDAFLQGKYYEDHFFIPNNNKTAVDYYRKAVADDPHFVLAWARLAHVLSGIALDSGSDTDAAQAKSALDHALALAPDSPDVRLAQAWYLDYVKKDLDGALAAFAAVARSQPNNAQVLLGVGVMHGHKWQWREALGFLQKAATLAPEDTTILAELGVALEALRRYPEAVQTARRSVAIDPNDAAGWVRLGHAYELMGDPGGALTAYQEAPPGVRDNPYLTFNRARMELLQRNYAAARELLAGLKPTESLPMALIEFERGVVEQGAGNAALAREHYLRAQALQEATYKRNPNSDKLWELGYLSARLGQREQALTQIALAMREDAAKKQFSPFNEEGGDKDSMAEVQAMLGNAGAAVEALDWLLARPAGTYESVPLLRIDPTWDPIRHDPRFQALLKKYASARPEATGTRATSSTQ